MDARRIAVCKAGSFSEQAAPLLEATMAVASGYPVPDEGLPPVALSMAFQAAVNACCDTTEISTIGVLKAFASGFASWVSRVVDDEEQAEAALIAFQRGYQRTRAAIVADAGGAP